jgi:transposase
MIVRQPKEVSMDITPIHRRVVGLDVHQNKITACALIEQPDGSVTVEHREFGGFKRDRRALAEWVRGFAPDIVVMESTGIYWKSPYAALEQVGLAAWVVNARHVKNVPGRKTDISDAQWLATWRGRVWCGPRSFLRPRSATCA